MPITIEQSSDGRAIVPIRYDGRDAENHQIELFLLGESLEGIARILAVAGHFAATGQYAKQFQALDVKVYVTEPKANCYLIHSAIEFAKQQQLFSGVIGLTLAPILGWIIARASNNRAEMKAIKDSLDKAIEQLAGQHSAIVPRLLDTVDRMAESLRPAVRAAVAPVGKTCSKMSIGDAVIDEASATAIREGLSDEITEEKTWTILITEIDLETSTAKIRLADDEEAERRFKAIITDPAMNIVGNPYVVAFARQKPIAVRGKATLRDGELQTLFVSNTA